MVFRVVNFLISIGNKKMLKYKMSYDKSKPVWVYRNLRKNCWSIMQNGLVINSKTTLCLKDVKFVVRPAGRARVLKEKRKNVHAFAVGFISKSSKKKFKNRISYNPYTAPFFKNATGAKISFSDEIQFKETGMYQK